MSSTSSQARFVQELARFLTKTPTPRKYLGAGAMFSPTGIDAILSSTPRVKLTAQQQTQYMLAVAQTFSSSDTDDAIEKTAKEAYEAANQLSRDLFDLHYSVIVGLPKAGDADRMVRAIITLYGEILAQSIDLARGMAQCGETFENEIIPFCADATIPVSQRRTKIEEWQTQASTVEQQAKKVQITMDELIEKYTEFARDLPDGPANISGFGVATEKEGPTLTDYLKQLGPDVEFDLPLLTLAASLPGPLPAVLMLGGLISIDTSETRKGSLAIGAAVAKAEAQPRRAIRDGDKVVYNCERELGSLRTGLAVLGRYWTKSQNDAREIVRWLEEGASDEVQPAYMQKHLDEGIRLYSQMAKYLRVYAQGIDKINADK